MVRSLLDVPVEELILEDETYCSSLQRDTKPLEESAKKVGILVPLRLERAPEGFRIVSGFLRAKAALSLGLRRVPAQVLEAGFTISHLLDAIYENLFTRGFTWAERTWVLERVIQVWNAPRPWIIRELLPAMGLPPTPRALEEHLQAANIPRELRGALVRHGCSLSNAARLSRMEIEDQEALVRLLPSLHLGENLLRECLELLWEIWLRDGILPRHILSDPSLLGAMEARGEDRPQRTTVLREHLQRARMPLFKAMEDAFRKARAQLGLPPQISVQHGPFFEQGGVSISFRARTAKELVDMSRRLWEACQRIEIVDALLQATYQAPEPSS